jgi:hypothetical protein
MLKALFKILLWCLLLLATYFAGHRWMGSSEIGIEGFFLMLSATVLLGYEAITFSFKKGLLKQAARTNLLLLLATTLVVAMVMEVALRLLAPNLESAFEKNYNKGYRVYRSPYQYYMAKCDSCGGRYEYVCGPHVSDYYKTAEFSYLHTYNGYGLRDAEFKASRDSNEYRILGLGDSFVEGVGAPVDSTWVKQLEHRLNASSDNLHYTTMNAGVHGSDLFFSYELLTRCLLQYKPDLVILNLNSTDIYETMMRGSFDRFDAEGNFHRPKGPWWEFAFGSSYIVRLVALNLLHYDFTLINPHQYRYGQQQFIDLIARKVNDYYRLSKEQHFAFLLVLQPLQNELEGNDNFAQRLHVDTAIERIDLTEHLNREIKLNPPKSRYYWPIDGHFTGDGYYVEAEVIYGYYFAKRWAGQIIKH